ncbi:MAG TPA: hypothetical protein PLD20_16875 [Blastocatellia bacterium]|nr:hypothetical protein [Blastocatellia bacterium]HMV86045.1 hypothetical protein [Blastocatellia bacterium]HMX30402.1 hypothetical protein [Blastocatellia bacterium]HMY70252.1 hypothetical protein [Blastocatellia bacterium]HMZ19612.1 hypothetical protein [Blastocatellia bacterium]
MKHYQFLLALLPAALCFGPFSMTQFGQPWLMVGGGMLMTAVLSGLLKEIKELQNKVKKLEDQLSASLTK